jgi:hypothetical protein
MRCSSSPAPDVIAAHVQRARESVSDAFRHIFDEQLVQAHERLVAEPADLAAKVRFVTEAVRDFALGGLTRRLDIIGVPLDSL